MRLNGWTDEWLSTCLWWDRVALRGGAPSRLEEKHVAARLKKTKNRYGSFRVQKQSK